MRLGCEAPVVPFNAARVRMLDVPTVVTGSRFDSGLGRSVVGAAIDTNLPRLQLATARNPRVPYAVRVEFVLGEAGWVADRRERAVNLGLRHLAVSVEDRGRVTAPVDRSRGLTSATEHEVDVRRNVVGARAPVDDEELGMVASQGHVL